MVLGIAYAASIGGMATLLGSPPNAAMAGILLKEYNISISFWDWFQWGFPFSIILLIICFIVLIAQVKKEDWVQCEIATNIEKTSLNAPQKRVLIYFVIIAML